MPKCEECKKEVKRRKTYIRADLKMKVCDSCAVKLSYNSYAQLSNYIIHGNKGRQPNL